MHSISSNRSTKCGYTPKSNRSNVNVSVASVCVCCARGGRHLGGHAFGAKVCVPSYLVINKLSNKYE